MFMDVTINQCVGKSMQRVAQFLHLLICQGSFSEDAPTLWDAQFGHKNAPRRRRAEPERSH